MAPMEFVKMRADAVLYFLPVSVQSIGYAVSAEMFASVICTNAVFVFRGGNREVRYSRRRPPPFRGGYSKALLVMVLIKIE